MKRLAGGFVAIAAVAWLALSPQGQQMLSPGPLGGDHHGRKFACTKCHTPFTGVPDTKCMTCHKSIKRQVARRTQGLHSTTAGACRTCHSSHRGKRRIVPTRVKHSKFGFSLEEHERMACAKCHGKKLRQASQELCSSCHLRRAERKNSKRMIDHLAKTENGPPKCWGCHTGGDRVEFRHDGVTSSGSPSCESCHDSRRHGKLEADCNSCHTVNAWKPAKSGHRPELSGEHRGAGCRKCHGAERLGSMSDCATCHRVPGGHFAGSCSDCHQTKSWRSVSISHPRVREHSYRSFACVKCHPSGYSSSSCVSCHRSGNPEDDEDEDGGGDDDDD